ncbi:hypothetical protein KTG15_02610 [Methanobacterium sp. YSL]|nr:hypothetical protein [Methanobacterium sp. YSL]
MVTFNATTEFISEKKDIFGKYHSFESEFETFKKALKVSLPDGLPDTKRISGLGNKITIPIYKVRKIRCRSLKRGENSGLRIIYACSSCLSRVVFIEIYYKGNKENEDRERIYRYFTDLEDI